MDPHIFADPNPGSQNVANPITISKLILKLFLKTICLITTSNTHKDALMASSISKVLEVPL